MSASPPRKRRKELPGWNSGGDKTPVVTEESGYTAQNDDDDARAKNNGEEVATASRDAIGNRLPSEIEHVVHEFLRIAEVCALQPISESWCSRIRAALRERFWWDLRHCEGVDAAAHLWLTNVAKARVKIRSLHLDLKHAQESIREAAKLGLTSAVELLLWDDEGGDTIVNAADSRGLTPLHLACEGDHSNAVKALLRAPNIDVNAADHYDVTPLHLATGRDVARLLIAAPGVNVTAVDNHDMTPLHWAAEFGYESVELLLTCEGSDTIVNAANCYGQTPLHLASEGYHSNAVKALLAVPNIDATAVDDDGLTPLHLARGRDVARLLIAAPGVNVNAANNHGATPLHWAAKRDCCEVYEVLATIPGLDANATDNDGRSVFDYALLPITEIEMRHLLAHHGDRCHLYKFGCHTCMPELASPR